MKKLILIVVSVLGYCPIASAQAAFDPQLIILSPKNVSFDPILKPEIDKKNDELKLLAQKAQNANAAQSNSAQSQNIKLMQQSSISFAKHLDVFNQISFYAQQYLIYRFYQKFPNCLILLKDEKSKGNLHDLQLIASAEHTAFILNIPSLSFYKSKGETVGKLQIQLYQTETNTLLLDQEYEGDWNSHGFEWTCETGSMGCCINNALSHAMPDVIFQIASHNQTLIREKQIASQQAAFIKSNIFLRTFNPALIRTVIKDTTIGANDLYQGLYNNDSTKFVGFFLKRLEQKDQPALLDQKSDQNVKVITSKDIHTPGYLDQKPGMYAYIVKAVKYQNKWYYEKTEVTYFDAANIEEGKLQYLNNLEAWDFFKTDSPEPSDNFWEGHLFKKVADKRKDPDWEKYKDMRETEERDDRDYIGLYEIVADKMKKDAEIAANEFNYKILKELLIPFYNKQVQLKANHIFEVKKPEAFSLIYPKDKHVILNPVEVINQDGITQIRYFVLFRTSNEIFEWTYVQHTPLGKREYAGEQIIKTLGALTKWTFACKTLDDTVFWNEKVLLKDGATYKYLKKLN